MQLADVLAPNRVVLSSDIASKKRSLEELAKLLALGAGGLTNRDLFDTLLARERLGVTGLGDGLALPHGRHPDLAEPVAAVLRLSKGVDYDSSDGRKVDLLIALVVPEASTDLHLSLLADIAGRLRDPDYCARLRAAPDSDALHALLSGPSETGS